MYTINSLVHLQQDTGKITEAIGHCLQEDNIHTLKDLTALLDSLNRCAASVEYIRNRIANS